MNIKQTIQSTVATSVMMLAVVTGFVISPTVQASIVIGGTRIIFQANEKEATAKLSNQGASPALIQAWIDTGDMMASPSSIQVPFTVMPPMARIDPGKGQTLRILYTGEPLPENKESVFWLNVLEVPPKPTGEAAESNHLQVSYRTRIKLFYRPPHLEGDASSAPSKITWHVAQSGKALEAHNSTPFYVSLTSLEVDAGGHPLKIEEGGMVAPDSSIVFVLHGDVPLTAGAKVQYRAISDWGGSIEGTAAVLGAN